MAVAVDAPNASTAPHAIEWVLMALGPAALGLFLWRRWDRLDQSPSPPAVSPLVGGVVFLGMFMAGPVGARLAGAALGEEAADPDLAPLWVSAVLLSSAFGAQALFVLAARPWWRSEAARRGPGLAGAVLAGAAALALFWPMVNFTVQSSGFVIERLGGPPAELIGHDTLLKLMESPRDVWFWAIAVLVIVPAPILEEILYRRILQSTLRPLLRRRWLAIVATSVVFAAMHFDVAQPQAVAGIFVLSLGFGWVYERTGRLAAPVAMHMLFNAGNVGVALLMT